MSTLEELENTIRTGLKAFYAVGFALKQIKSSGLYKQLGYENFDAYCQERWGWKRTYAFFQIKAAEVVNNLSGKTFTNGEQNEPAKLLPMPTNERQIRAIAEFPVEVQPLIWERAVIEVGGIPTAKVVTKVAKEVAIEKGLDKPKQKEDRVDENIGREAKEQVEETEELKNPEELVEILSTEEQVEKSEKVEEVEMVEEESIMITEEINPNLVVNAFVNNLEYLGTEQIKIVMRAIAQQKKEVVTEVVVGLADDEDKAIEIVRAIAKKYPHVAEQAIEEF